MLRTEAVSTVPPTAPVADRVGRVAMTSAAGSTEPGDRLEPKLTSNHQRRSEMKALWGGAAAVIDKAGPTAAHGGSFVYQGQSHSGEHSPVIDFAAATTLTRR